MKNDLFIFGSVILNSWVYLPAPSTLAASYTVSGIADNPDIHISILYPVFLNINVPTNSQKTAFPERRSANNSLQTTASEFDGITSGTRNANLTAAAFHSIYLYRSYQRDYHEKWNTHQLKLQGVACC